MTLLSAVSSRESWHNHILGASTAAVAGMVNVCSVMAFFAFATNVTGHVAVFAEELVKGHQHQVTIVGIWLLSFLLGAGLANFLAFQGKDRETTVLWSTIPLGVELLLLAGVGYYGTTTYGETLRETEVLVSVLLFAMGIQNGLVATVSGGVVKTTHLTGLLTDLGMELALFLRAGERSRASLRFKLHLHLLVLFFYILGGLSGGLSFQRVQFNAFYLASLILALVVAHDLATFGVIRGKIHSRRVSPLAKLSSVQVPGWERQK